MSEGDTTQTGRVLNIQRFSTEDGPGIRTTVFLMGCALKCQWCQNPETWTVTPQLVWYQDRCIGIQHCLSACPNNALSLTADGMKITRNLCDGCGACIPVCPTKALELLGSERTVEDVVAEVLRDKPFYEESSGGVTLSGGDPLFQHQFAHKLLLRFSKEGLHRALDTAGYASQEIFQKITKESDLVLLDLKQMNPDLHKKYTGVPLEPILANAKWLGEQEKPVWIRTPIIPGLTDSPNNIAAIAAFIRLHLPNVERWDLLGFNKLCKAKWHRLDRAFPCEDTQLVSEKQITALVETAKNSQI
ncbi:MAG: glycyl-radical enzyme activating protein, partial [Promethearchaeota archaeon]